MNSVRTLFLSDIHLGTRACQAEHLLAFLKDYDCENLFLVGDIIDFWAMNRSVHWPASHNTVVQKILKRAEEGSQNVKNLSCKVLRPGTMKCELSATKKTAGRTQSVAETYFWNRFDDVALVRVSTESGIERLKELKKSVRVQIKGISSS
jgi:hypothetical protein